MIQIQWLISHNYAFTFCILCSLVVFCVAAVAQDVWRVAVLEKFWCQWNNVLQSRHVEKDRGQRADKLAQHGSQQLAFSHWRHCIFAYTVKQTFSYTFILEEKMKYVSESMMVPNAVVFLSCLVDVSLCSQKAKSEKAAMHHRQLHLLVSCVLVLRNVNVLLYSLFVCLFNYVGLVFFHSIWV